MHCFLISLFALFVFFSLIRFMCGYSEKVAGGGAIELVATGVIIIGKEIEIFFKYINLFY